MDGSPDYVQFDAAMFEDGFLDCGLAPQQGPQPRQQLIYAKWLRKIVIRPQIKAGNSILHSVARAQNQHRLVETRFSPLLQQLQSIPVRQPKIEDDCVRI